MKIRVWFLLLIAFAAIALPLAKTAHPTGKITAALFDGGSPVPAWHDGNFPMPPWQIGS